MTCVVCKSGRYKEDFTTVVLTKGDSTVIIKQVPASVCDQGGEYILSKDVTKLVLAMADEAYKKGTEVEIRKFVA